MNSKTSRQIFRRPLGMAFALPLAGVAFITVLTGCGRRVIVQTPPPTVINTQTPAPQPPPSAPLASSTREIVVVKEAPPPPRQETQSMRPTPDHTWVAGYWAVSSDGRQQWVPGRWELPPRPGAMWVAPRWEQRPEGYVYIEGGWR